MYLEFRQGKPQGTFLLKEMLARIGDSETRIFRIAEAPFFSFSCVWGGEGTMPWGVSGILFPKITQDICFFLFRTRRFIPIDTRRQAFFEFGKNGTNMEIRNSRLDFSRIRVYILLKFGNLPAVELKKQERNPAMRVMAINGSPRKNWNTAKVLQSAMKGAEAAGAETEFVNLYDLSFCGCKSCFACKIKNSKTGGVCAIRDELRPVLERAREADVLILGTPVYYSYPTGVMRSFMERLMFPVGTYLYENGRHVTLRDKVIPTAMIFTMNCPENYMKQIGYPPILEENTKVMADIFGYSETLYVCNTYQFNDYSRYDFNLFREEDKRKYRDEHFAIDLQNAYDLGRRLTEKAGA